MSFTADLLEKPPALSRASQWTAMNGYIYLGLGALFAIWPGAVQTLFRDDEFAGHEKALFRVIGLTVMVIGWLYLFGGRCPPGCALASPRTAGWRAAHQRLGRRRADRCTGKIAGADRAPRWCAG